MLEIEWYMMAEIRQLAIIPGTRAFLQQILSNEVFTTLRHKSGLLYKGLNPAKASLSRYPFAEA